MAQEARSDSVQNVYSALVGGFISAFLLAALYSTLLSNEVDPWATLAAGIAGCVFSGLALAGGLALADRMPWLGTALLWSSGFTMLWSLLFGALSQPRWALLAALGVLLAAGLVLGWLRYRTKADPPVAALPVPVESSTVGSTEPAGVEIAAPVADDRSDDERE
jgi:FtsH-binding integral membrane protein